METEYSKRVYQGVRVKHTVKDLLAEKRLRQTNGPRYNGGTSPPQSAFVQMPGSHGLPGYYGIRRPIISDADLCHAGKTFPTEGYPSNLGAKSLSCDPTTATGYPSFMDGYYPESLGDYRNPAFSSGGSSLFPPATLPSLLPPFSGDSSHFFLRDSWEQNPTDAVNQTEGLCSDRLATAPPSMTNPETTSPSHYQTSGRSSGLSASQSYSLHSLDDVHYPSPYPAALPTYPPCPSYMTAPNEIASKMAPLPSEDSDTAPPTSDAMSWAKDDGSGSWSPYEVRRAY